MDKLRFWVISEEALINALKQVESGDAWQIVLMELIANSELET